MCGIAGIISNHDSKLEQNLNQMIKTLSHRGPDANGSYKDNSVFLGHSRLSIIDLLPRSNQPMLDVEENFAIVFNGEIYNFQDLKNEMAGQYNFQTQSDTEVLLAGYIVFGEKILKKINGCFSFAIYDKEKRRVFIARDRLGIKPLYYHLGNNHFVFSSEIRSIISSKLISEKIDNIGLNQLIRYQSSIAPNTVLEDVKILKPGHFLNFNISEFNSEIIKYWAMGYELDGKRVIKYKDVKKEIYKKVTSAVQKRMISDVNVAAFLSGGIDSSIIVASMANLNLEKTINTFSLVHKDSEFDESKHSDHIARIYKTNHYKVEISDDDLLSELFEALNSYDSPSADGLNSYIVSKKISDVGIKAALSGRGGDELFAGYHIFKYWDFFKKSSNNINFLAKKIIPIIEKNIDVENIKLHKIMSLFKLKNRTSDDVNRVLRDVSGKYGDLIFNNEIEESLDIENKNNFSSDDYLISQYSISELSMYTSNVLLNDTDQMSMANGIEVRVPFLDHELVEYVLSLPDTLKNFKNQKQLLVDAFIDFIPAQIYKRKKQGFVIPINKWMQKELFDFSSNQIEKICDNNFFKSDQVKRLWDYFLTNKKYGSVLWSLIVFNNWLEKNLNSKN